MLSVKYFVLLDFSTLNGVLFGRIYVVTQLRGDLRHVSNPHSNYIMPLH